jgi:hypothetical protein
VRSVYLYVMCAVSLALVLLGLGAAAVGLVHTVAPDLGHRDTLDRVGIGLSNVGSDIVDIFNESQEDQAVDFCEEVTDNESDFDDCVQDEQTVPDDSMRQIQQGIGEVKQELRSQIRNNSIDRMIRGLLMVAAGVVLFRIHGRRTDLFADGLMPKGPDPEPAPPVAPLPPPEPLPAPEPEPPAAKRVSRRAAAPRP